MYFVPYLANSVQTHLQILDELLKHQDIPEIKWYANRAGIYYGYGYIKRKVLLPNGETEVAKYHIGEE